jgi:phosphoribosylformylglycinamidine synthase
MAQFSDVIDGVSEACNALGTPITGGNVSLYNETLGVGIYPTPVIGVVGILDDVSKAMTSYFRHPDRDVLLLSAQSAVTETEFGSSEYAKEILGELWGQPPALDLKKEAALQSCLIELSQGGHIESAHDCSEGGLAVCLAEGSFPAGIGAALTLPESRTVDELALFGEEASRVVISCDPAKTPDIKKIAGNHAITAEILGQTRKDKLEIRRAGKNLLNASVSELKKVWSDALKIALHSETPEHLVPEVLQKS